MDEPRLSQPTADRNLLFGILALQMDFISRDALIAAMHTWVLAKHKPLAEILEELGALRPDARALLELVVAKHVEFHGDDPQKSLASVSSIGSLRQDLERVVDSDVQASLVHVSIAHPDRPFSTRIQTQPPDQGRFRILRPHARGGLGEVFVALDAELNREVALKEIKPEHAHNPASQGRFLLEAEITGGLEHPGIVPVYGLGHYSDGRPFYAMRFIKGANLSEAIKQFHEVNPAHGDARERSLALRGLLRRFIDVCNALAYAHSRGVLHRDLKPGNVMLGKYGETLVVDWGLAKAQGDAKCKTPGIQQEFSQPSERVLIPSSARGSPPTVAGEAIGTPAYMSPEQAGGRLDELGPASDVYSLGATLYHLLVGRPPVEGQDVGEVLQKVERGEVASPRPVWSKVPKALQAICRKAMALNPGERYEGTAALADDIEHWLADEPVSAYAEPLATRVGRWVRRHQVMVSGAAASTLVALLLGGGSAFLWERQLAARRADEARQEGQMRQAVESALEQATRFQERARWDEARVTLSQAASRLVDGKPEDLHLRVESARQDLDLVARLDRINQKAAALVRQGLNFTTVGAECADAFREAGLGSVGDPPSIVGEQVRASAVHGPLVAALDFWSFCARGPAESAWVLDVLRQADPDPWRNRARDKAHWNDLAALARLAREAPLEPWTPQLLAVVGARLHEAGEGRALLRRAQQRYPDDFWINFALGFVLEEVSQEEALGFYRASLALRPATPALLNNMGEMLYELGRHEEAVQTYRQALALDSRYAFARHNLGQVLRDMGRLEAAQAEFDQAVRLGFKPPTEEARRCQQLITLRARLPGVLEGKHRPADGKEWLAFAVFCQQPFERRYAAAARLYAEAFVAQPALAQDLGAHHRYNAACCAVLAGCALSGDAATLDEAARAKLRLQALDWLKADLALLSKQSKSWIPLVRTNSQKMLKHWRRDTDLINVRYAGTLGKVAAPEREAWIKLWGEVDELLKR